MSIANCTVSRDSHKQVAVRMRHIELQVLYHETGEKFRLSSASVAKSHVRSGGTFEIMTEQCSNTQPRVDEVRAVSGKVESIQPDPSRPEKATEFGWSAARLKDRNVRSKHEPLGLSARIYIFHKLRSSVKVSRCGAFRVNIPVDAFHLFDTQPNERRHTFRQMIVVLGEKAKIHRLIGQ